jgi:hypothetical protein
MNTDAAWSGFLDESSMIMGAVATAIIDVLSRSEIVVNAVMSSVKTRSPVR